MAIGRIANDGASAPPPVAPAEPETASIASVGEQAAPPRSDDPERSTAALEASCPRATRPAVPRRHVLVRVVDDHDGQPVAGATVAASIERDGPISAAERRRWTADADPFARLQARGQTTQTDAEGYAILLGSHWMDVMAQHGERFASAELELEGIGPEGFELRLRPASVRQIRVVDQNGQTLAGVPLALRVHLVRSLAAGNDLRVDSLGRTGRDGTLRTRLEHHLQGFEQAARLEVFVEAPGLSTTAAVVEEGSPIELVLPPYGAVAIEVAEADGAPLADDPTWTVTLQQVGQAALPLHERARVSDLGFEGTVRFPYVGLGLELAATTELGGPTLRARLAGPRHDGELVRHRMRVSNSKHARLRGRLIDEHGEPWVHTRLMAERGGRSDWNLQPVTDAAGRFQLRLVIADEPTGPLRFTSRQDNGPLGHSHEVHPPPGSDLDLGDLVMTRGAILARGTIVEERPIPPGLSLHVESWQDDSWRDSDSHRVQFDGDTAFTVRSLPTALPTRLRLRVAAPGCAAIAPIEFAPGAELSVVLRPGLALQARILVQPEWLGTIVNECYVVLTNEYGTDDYLSTRIVDGAWLVDFRSACPGRYRLALEGAATVAVDDIVVAPDATVDPRLDPWDLRSALQLLQVQAVDAYGRPVETGGTVYRRDEHGDWLWSGYFEADLARSLLPNQPFDLLVCFDRGGVATVANAMGFVQVAVPSPTSVAVALEGWPELIAGAPIEVDLVVDEVALAEHAHEDARLMTNVVWQPQQRTVTAELYAPVQASLHILHRVDAHTVTLLADLPCELSPTRPHAVVTVTNDTRMALQPWTRPQ